MTEALGSLEFDYIRQLVLEQSAIVLDVDKRYLVESRLGPLAKLEGFSSVATLVARLRAEPRNGIHAKVVEAMTTNETSFFRDLYPFETLRQHVIPQLLQKRAERKSLNIWCAAASTGQEPYSIAMLLRECFPQLASWTVRLLATDLSVQVLDRARTGRYNQMEVNRGMPAVYLIKYFEKDGLGWQIRERIRRMIEFKQMNLIEAWPSFPVMDIIFMRNVLIYFNVETKRRILQRTRKQLSEDGCLFMGGAETTLNVDENLERVQVHGAAYYRLRQPQ